MHSARWHEVAALRPELRSSIEYRRQSSRGVTWHLLSGPGSRQQLRLNEAAWRLVGLFDGTRDLDTLWQAVFEQCGDSAPSQDEVIGILNQLHEASFLKSNVQPDTAAHLAAQRRRTRRQQLAALNPFSIRVPLFDPTPVLHLAARGLAPALTTGAIGLIAVLTLLSLLFAVTEWSAIANELAATVESPRFVVLALCVYPLMKALHELSHGLALRHYGGESREAGFTLLVLAPVPYVEASSANLLGRGERLVVSGAGIACELALAAVAFWLWLATAPGIVHDIALTTLFIGLVSTLVFNGNPFLRFDGYYILSDALDVPNLASRSRRWWQSAIGRSLFGARMQPIECAPREQKWLVAYAPAAWFVQAFIGWQIVAWIDSLSPVISVIGAIFLVAMLVVQPLIRAISTWLDPERARTRSQVRRRLAAVTILLAALVALVPMPSGSVVPGVVALSESARIHSEHGGVVTDLRLTASEPVAAGTLIATLDDPALAAATDRARSHLEALESRQYAALLTAPADARSLANDITLARSELNELERRVDALQVRAHTDGRLILTRPDDIAGSFLPRGHTLGYVRDERDIRIKAMIPHADAVRVRKETQRVTVRLASHPRPLDGQLRSIAAGAAHTLPSPALSDRFGGDIPTHPQDEDATRAIGAFYAADVGLNPGSATRIGERAWVRFEFPAEPLATQWARQLRQTLLRFFTDGGLT